MVNLLAGADKIWDELIDLLQRLENEGHDYENLEDLIRDFENGVLDVNNYRLPNNYSLNRFKYLVEHGIFDLEPKPVERVYTREFGKPDTYPPKEFIEHYEQCEFTNIHFDFPGGYERYKEMVLRGER